MGLGIGNFIINILMEFLYELILIDLYHVWWLYMNKNVFYTINNKKYISCCLDHCQKYFLTHLWLRASIKLILFSGFCDNKLVIKLLISSDRYLGYLISTFNILLYVSSLLLFD